MLTSRDQEKPTPHDVAKASFEGLEANTLSFPETIQMIAAAGFNSYLVDYCKGSRTYHHSSGQSFTFQGPTYPPADTFRADVVKKAIKEAQMLVPGYTYQGFCRTVTQSGGTAGYLVSIIGKRVLYFGVNDETHTEYFPGTAPQ